MMRRILALVLLCLPVAVPAQEISFSMAATDACLAAGEGDECIGRSASACMDETPGGFGYSTHGMIHCIDAELSWWQGEYERVYALLWDAARRYDEAEGKYPPPHRTDAAADMRATWEAWRDARCAYETYDMRGGSGAGIIDVGCRLEMTGREVLWMRATLAVM